MNIYRKTIGLCFNNLHISSCVHTGSSMNPILQNFDILEIEPYTNRQICTGDIIYFQIPERYEHSGNQEKIVHRIIKITSKGIHTRGDNSRTEDPWILNPNNIYGIITGYSRSGRHRKIAGGHKGKIEGFIFRRYCSVMRAASNYLSKPYHFLSETDICKRFLPVGIYPKTLIFQAKDEKHIHIMMGKKMIGRYDAALKRWIIKRPFRLFVNEKSLPCFHDKF